MARYNKGGHLTVEQVAKMMDTRKVNETFVGEKNNKAVLTNEDALDIKIRLARGERQIDIASRYGVVRYVICDINRRRTWKHIIIEESVSNV